MPRHRTAEINGDAPPPPPDDDDDAAPLRRLRGSGAPPPSSSRHGGAAAAAAAGAPGGGGGGRMTDVVSSVMASFAAGRTPVVEEDEPRPAPPLRPRVTITSAETMALRLFALSRGGGGSGGGGGGAGAALGAGGATKGKEYIAALRAALKGANGDTEANAFELLALVFGFQPDNVRCQLDNAKGILASRLTRLEIVGAGTLGGVLDFQGGGGGGAVHAAALLKLRDYRDELLSNYHMWCEFMGVAPHSLVDTKDKASQYVSPFGDDEDGTGAALEVALYLLIWGEASNMRFCPEFLAWLYHKMSQQLVDIMRTGNVTGIVFNTFLGDVIRPAYDLLALQLANAGHEVVDHSTVKQYDDFNETFWQARCLALDVKTAFLTKNKDAFFSKTFVERQSWIHVIFIFWRVHTFTLVSLFTLIMVARCDLAIGATPCSKEDLLTPVMMLYLCQIVGELQGLMTAFALATHVRYGSSFVDVFFFAVRAAWRAGVLLGLLILYFTENKYFWLTAAISGGVALLGEVLCLVPFAYKHTPSRAQLTQSGNGLRFRAWLAVLQALFVNASSLRVFTTGVLRCPPPLRKRLVYIFFWALVLATKLSFGYFAVIRKLYEASDVIFNMNVKNNFDFVFFTIADPHNIGLLAALWIGSITIYFVDTHIWYVLWANVFALLGGLWRRVGEVASMTDVLKAFGRAHRRMLTYLPTTRLDKHVKFAAIWNEVVESMRAEDIVNDAEADSLKYYVMTIGERVTGSKPIDRPQLPSFLFAGAISRSLQAIKVFADSQSEKLREIKRLEGLIRQMDAAAKGPHATPPVWGSQRGGLGRQHTVPSLVDGISRDERKKALGKLRSYLAGQQARWLGGAREDDMLVEAASQAFLAAFLLIDGLMGDFPQMSMALGDLYKAFFGIPDDNKGYIVPRDKKVISALTSTSLTRYNALLYNLHLVPAAIAKLAALAEAAATPSRAADVPALWSAFSTAARAALACDAHDAAARSAGEAQARALLAALDDALAAAPPLREEAAAALTRTRAPLLRRLVRLLTEPASSQPGHVGGGEARRRIQFFINTLFMERPDPQRAVSMPSWSTLTPYYNEEVILPLAQLRQQTQDGVTTLEYLRTIYTEEWDAFVERLSRQYGAGGEVLEQLKSLIYSEEINAKTMADTSKLANIAKRILHQRRVSAGADAPPGAASALPGQTPPPVARRASAMEEELERTKRDAGDILMQLQLWASFRAQTLARTVRGLMYHAQAVRMLAVVEGDVGAASTAAFDPSIPAIRRLSKPSMGTTPVAVISSYYPHVEKTSDAWLDSAALAEAKYRYVVSCQIYGKMNAAKEGPNKDKAKAIAQLARDYEGLRIAYVDEVEGTFYSVLLRWGRNEQTGEDGMLEEYRVELPGQILVGEGKPNNQNHAIIFTRGEAIQAIDMNQDGSLEEALKQREMLQEFGFGERRIGLLGGRSREAPNLGRIVGFREHVFTHNVSSIANFFSLQETGFVTATQRVLDEPLAIRFHYGHPDVFDKTTAITQGGISRPSKGIHLSEDIFAGFYWVLRGGRSSQLDYIQAGKGRDVGVSQITGFTAKISMGNGMQARSREVCRLAQQLDFFRLMSFYYSSVGGFLTQCLLILSVFLYMYTKLFIAFDPVNAQLITDSGSEAVFQTVSSSFAIQLGFLLILPIPMVAFVEHGISDALGTLLGVLLRLSPFFFVFGAGTNSYYVNAAITQGTAKYQATGRGFVIEHENFLQGFRTYLPSHYLPALELLVLLLIYARFTIFHNYFLETLSVWLLVVGFLYSPLMFNPNGLDNQAVNADFQQWLTWLYSNVEDPSKSWLAWYSKVTETARQNCQFRKQIEITIMNLRLLLVAWGFVKGIEADRANRGQFFIGVGWMCLGIFAVVVIFFVLALPFNKERAKKRHPFDYGSTQRVRRVLMLVAGVLVVGALIGVPLSNYISLEQMVYTFFAFVFAAYFVTLTVLWFVPNALRRVAPVQFVLRAVALALGLLIQAPALLLSFLPFMADIQTRMLFNASFSARFSVAKVFAQEGRRKQIGGARSKGD